MAGALAAADCDRAVEESGDGGTICKVIPHTPTAAVVPIAGGASRITICCDELSIAPVIVRSGARGRTRRQRPTAASATRPRAGSLCRAPGV
jgi:hypothetical protein